MIPDTVKHIYYRGYLKSCNYRCSYCPFAKHPATTKEIQKDEEALNRFTTWVGEQKNMLSIMFVPYGEALIHSYYVKQLALLSRMPNVSAISCQTNLSLNPQKFIQQLRDENSDLSKLNLWATFHDEMESKERFSEKVEYLHKHIGVCVGVVGTPQMIAELSKFRSMLPQSVYLWVNAMDGLNRKYTSEEVNLINSIDPLFSLELANPKAEVRSCCAGVESLFVAAEGDVFACNRSKVRLGNIYDQNALDQATCKARSCDCFLAYVHRKDLACANIFEEGRFFRVPKGISIDTIFFDIDGTLTNADGCIDESAVEAVGILAQKQQIYLATALPYTYALRKCKSIRQYLSGGVFANGADVRHFANGYRHTTQMQPLDLHISNNIKILTYTDKGKLFKLAITGKQELVDKLYQQLLKEQSEKYHIILEDGVVSLTDKSATKFSGVLHLCNELNVQHNTVMVVGNGENDIDMLKHFHHSVAVQSSNDEVKKHAAYSMKINQLPIFTQR